MADVGHPFPYKYWVGEGMGGCRGGELEWWEVGRGGGDIRGSPRQYFRSFGLFLIIRGKLPFRQGNSGRFARHDYFSASWITGY